MNDTPYPFPHPSIHLIMRLSTYAYVQQKKHNEECIMYIQYPVWDVPLIQESTTIFHTMYFSPRSLQTDRVYTTNAMRVYPKYCGVTGSDNAWGRIAQGSSFHHLLPISVSLSNIYLNTMHALQFQIVYTILSKNAWAYRDVYCSGALQTWQKA